MRLNQVESCSLTALHSFKVVLNKGLMKKTLTDALGESICQKQQMLNIIYINIHAHVHLKEFNRPHLKDVIALLQVSARAFRDAKAFQSHLTNYGLQLSIFTYYYSFVNSHTFFVVN